MSKYYEFVLKKLNSIKLVNPSELDIKNIEEEEQKEVRDKLDKLKRDLAKLEVDGETIH